MVLLTKVKIKKTELVLLMIMLCTYFILMLILEKNAFLKYRVY